MPDRSALPSPAALDRAVTYLATTRASDEDKPTALYGALARASALIDGDPEWWTVTRWVPGQPDETRRRD